MARSRKQYGGEIPEQDRYSTETAANQELDLNIIPRSEINSNAAFPTPKPGRAGGSTISPAEGEAEFIHQSHTNGRK
jgi:hypothetical protein